MLDSETVANSPSSIVAARVLPPRVRVSGSVGVEVSRFGLAERLGSGYNANMLPPGQQRLLDAIADHWRVKCYAPSYRELADTLGIQSTNGVAAQVAALVKKGYLLKEPGIARSVRLAGGRVDG